MNSGMAIPNQATKANTEKRLQPNSSRKHTTDVVTDLEGAQIHY